MWSRHRDRGARRPGRAPVCPIARRLDASYLLDDRFEQARDVKLAVYEYSCDDGHGFISQIRGAPRPSLGGGMSPDSDGESTAPGRDAHLYATDAALFSHR